MINDYTAFFITDQVKCWRLELFNAAILENIQMVIICRSFEPQPSIDNLSYITLFSRQTATGFCINRSSMILFRQSLEFRRFYLRF